MIKYLRRAATAAVTVLTACTVTGPVAVITDRDGVLRGTYIATLSEGSFRVANVNMTCTGSYNSTDAAATIEVVFKCEDGRKGFAIVTRTGGGNGHGTLRMNDGTTGNLVMGAAAASL